MKQKEEFRTVFHRVLRIPFVFELVQTIAGSKKIMKTAMDIAFNENRKYSFLDLGCGTGSIIPHIPSGRLGRYVGLDVNKFYISQCRQRFPDSRFDFFASDVQNCRQFVKDEKFDLVYLGGVLHHLSDEASNNILSFIPGFLAPGGRAVIGDPIFYDGQSYLARKTASMDRGKYVREAPEYLNLLRQHFKHTKPHVFEGLLRYPNTIQITECQI